MHGVYLDAILKTRKGLQARGTLGKTRATSNLLGQGAMFSCMRSRGAQTDCSKMGAEDLDLPRDKYPALDSAAARVVLPRRHLTGEEGRSAACVVGI